MEDSLAGLSALVIIGTGCYLTWKWIQAEEVRYQQQQEQYKILFERLVVAVENQTTGGTSK
jgi:predicted negative regulator of RcsB-dependent stress response